MPLRTLIGTLLVLAACSGGGGDGGGGSVPFGLTTRVTVPQLNFPGLPQPGTVAVVRAFPNLSFDTPLYIAEMPGGGRLVVVERNGRIWIFEHDEATTTKAVFLDISARVSNGGEEGLLGLAFHPEYLTNGWFYVYYSVNTGSLGGSRRTRLSRFKVSADPDVADAGSEEVLLEIGQPFSNHNGGMIGFGPDDKLYVGVGDGGSANDPQRHAQRLDDLLGKILRLNDDGTAVADNPHVGNPAARDEIWAHGMRNPWRFSFDRNTGRLWCADVGQNQIEEIDIIKRGANYGWVVFEGNRSNVNPLNLPASNFEPPVHTYTHSDGQSITGGYVYRGSMVPSLSGAYLYADYVSGRIWALAWDGTQVVSNEEIGSVQRPASFGEDLSGEVFICSFSSGTIHKLEENTGGGQVFPQKLSDTGLFTDTANLVPAAGLVEYDVNAPLWSDGALKRRWMALPADARITFRETAAWTFPAGTVLVKHFELELAPGTVRRLETRVLVKRAAGWEGFTYKWNAGESDADLLDDAETEVFAVVDPGAPGGMRNQTWYYPSRTDCLACHTQAAGPILGIRTQQINRDFRFPAATDNQLRSWNHIGLFTIDIGDATAYDAFADPSDATAPLSDRARAYLEVNCAVCHRPGSPTPVELDLRYAVAISGLNAVNIAAINAGGVASGLRIDPGDKERSVLWDRVRRTDNLRMPPLGSNVVDDVAVEVLGQWIDAGPN